MKRTLWLVTLLVGILVFGQPLYAAVAVNYVNGTTYNTQALTGYSTYGDEMDGMTVEVHYGDGTWETLYWADTGWGSGGVSSANMSLRESGDTYGGNWVLSLLNQSLYIDWIFIDAGTGDTVFDAWSHTYGTDGSAYGWAFDAYTNLDIDATYRDLVALTGFSPVGDLYRTLTIDFLGDGFGANNYLSFIADTDNLELAGDLTPAPIPGAVWLLGSGLVGLAGYRRKMRRS